MPVLKTPMRACMRITLALLLVVASAVASFARGPVSFAPLAAELQGAVVNISTTYIVNSNGRGFPFPNVPESSPLREFFLTSYSLNNHLKAMSRLKAARLGRAL